MSIIIYDIALGNALPRGAVVPLPYQQDGGIVPVAYGKNKIAGTVIWMGNFELANNLTPSSVGGGAGYFPTYKSFFYSAGAWFAVCMGKMQLVSLFVNDKQMVNANITISTGTAFTLYVSNRDVALSIGTLDIIYKSVLVTDGSGNPNNIYTEGTDYTIDYALGTITVKSTGNIANHATIYMWFAILVAGSPVSTGGQVFLTPSVQLQPFAVGRKSLIAGTVVVERSGTTYVEGAYGAGKDYSVDYANGTIRINTGGPNHPQAGWTYNVTFQYA
jgi:hypothetical protein